ncbi:Uncharacterised protein [uncultured archaeon]|nr:Uncharacterised protein [uncultured archaeon]
MPPEKYKGRCQDVIFSSTEERNSWLADAQKIGLTMSKYILEMARRGREKEASGLQGMERSNEMASQRKEIQDLHRKLRDTEKLLSRAEGDLFKLRHMSIMGPGDSPFSEDLVKILQRGGVHQGADILRKLKIDPGDGMAVQIIHKHLELLRDMGLAKEEARGWKWTG